MADQRVEPTVPPSGNGCVECLASGGWWFHLRRWARCGHIGCCDSSPSQHASAHAKSARPHRHKKFRARRGLVLRLRSRRRHGRSSVSAARSPSAQAADTGSCWQGATRLAAPPPLIYVLNSGDPGPYRQGAANLCHTCGPRFAGGSNGRANLPSEYQPGTHPESA
jgi:hypothetical protein